MIAEITPVDREQLDWHKRIVRKWQAELNRADRDPNAKNKYQIALDELKAFQRELRQKGVKI